LSGLRKEIVPNGGNQVKLLWLESSRGTLRRGDGNEGLEKGKHRREEGSIREEKEVIESIHGIFYFTLIGHGEEGLKNGVSALELCL